MAFSRDTRTAVRAHRRDSSSSSYSGSRQRPRLLRSTATEPSITTSNAGIIRGSLAGAGSPQKASDLLSRVAVYSPPPTTTHFEPSSAPEAIPRSQSEAIAICRDDRDSSPAGSPASTDVVLVDSPSGYYFSFPSFDDWNRDKREELEKDSDD